MKLLPKMKTTIVILAIFTCTICSANSGEIDKLKSKFKIIPAPAKIEPTAGTFSLKTNTPIILLTNNPEVRRTANYLRGLLSNATTYTVPITTKTDLAGLKNPIYMNLDPARDDLGKEGYELNIETNKISIVSQQPAGIFYATQSIRQLLPPEIEARQKDKKIDWSLPCGKVTDKPEFGWRGMHLDVCRHFFPKEFVKDYIDLLALHKMNIFHWHVTEDEGWRIQIDSYPRLTQVGAWRGKGDDMYGGYYTKDDIREILAYAKERYITVIPEIEMPGHCTASLYAYPEVSCIPEPYTTTDDSGRLFFTKKQGRMPYCAGKNETFEFLEGVLTEVMDMFDSPYIHIGGDERPEGIWDKCPDCQKRMKDLGLKDAQQLQEYFIKRIEKFIKSKNRRMMGWEQILANNLDDDSIIIAYLTYESIKKSVELKHDTVLAPAGYCYYDFYQGDPKTEPKAIGGFSTAETIYSFDPASFVSPDQKKYILGAQGQLWTEYVDTQSHAEYMVYPRASSLAETLWSPKESRNWKFFKERWDSLSKRFDIMGINYKKID